MGPLQLAGRVLSDPILGLKVSGKLPSSLVGVYQRGGLAYVGGYIAYYFAHYTGVPLDEAFWSWLKRKNHGSLLRARVLDHSMFLDIEDKGISRQLLLEGKREKGSLEVFTRELKRLQQAVGDEFVILDIGGNIGYYVLIEAFAAPRSRIYAVEPSPVNVNLLKKNVQMDGMAHRIDVTSGAISNKTGKAVLFLSNESNVHSMERLSDRSITVPTWTVDEFLSTKGLEPTKVNVLRMDTEGHEAKILEGVGNLLGANQPLLLFIEFHNTLIRDGHIGKIVDLLKSADLEFVYGCNDYFTGVVDHLYGLDDLPTNLKRHAAAQVFLKRGY